MKKRYYYHPICHILNGRRLYFILISIKSSLKKAQDEITDIITGSDMLHAKINLELESQCSYFIIGETDILLKIWICEERLAELESRFKTVDSISNFRIILIRNTNTWYERRLSDPIICLEKKEINAIISNDGFEAVDFPPNKLKLLPPAIKQNSDMSLGSSFKVWIFVDYSHAFREDALGLIEKNILSEENALKDINFVSFYRYHTNSKKGIIIKADLDNLSTALDKMFELIHKDHPVDLEYGSTTYISQSRIRDETHDWRSNNERDITLRKEHCVYNLIIKHDCSKNNVVLQTTQNSIVDQYTKEVSNHFYLIFESFNSEDFDISVERLRILYKWVVFGNNRSLTSFFLNTYTKVEREFGSILEPHYRSIKNNINGYNKAALVLQNMLEIDKDKAKEILNKINKKQRIFSGFLTLGNIPFVLTDLKKRLDLDDSDKKILVNTIEIVREMAQRRNPLAHGDISKIARGEDENGEYYWRSYLSNYVRYLFFVKPNISKLKSIISSHQAKSCEHK